MRPFEAFVLTYLVNSLWQAPVFFLAGSLASLVLWRSRPLAVHRVWVMCLVLAAVFPLVSSVRWPGVELWQFRSWSGAGVRGGVSVEFGPAVLVGGLRLPPALALAYGSVVGWFLLRLLWGLYRTVAMGRAARAVALEGEEAEVWDRVRMRFGCPRAVLVESEEAGTPLTLGVWRQRVVLPVGLRRKLSSAEWLILLAHECAHMRRRDFAWNLLYEFLALPVAYHPLLWLIRRRLVESREWVCDAAAAEAVGAPTVYAHSLLRLAALLLEGPPVKTPHAIGMLDANLLERRVMRITHGSKVEGLFRRAARFAVCGALTVAACGSAWAWRSGVVVAGMGQEAPRGVGPVRISGGVMAGQVVSRVDPVYPPDAKAAHLQGSVVMQAMISKTGSVENLTVVSGPSELSGAAIDAVKQWTYKPYFLNGEPVEVVTTITVNFQLNE